MGQTKSLDISEKVLLKRLTMLDKEEEEDEEEDEEDKAVLAGVPSSSSCSFSAARFLSRPLGCCFDPADDISEDFCVAFEVVIEFFSLLSEGCGGEWWKVE